MKALIELIRDLCLLRRGPQELPYSPSLCQALGLLSFLVSVAAASHGADPMPLVPALAVGLALMIGLPYVALLLADRTARFVQAASALFGVDVAFTLLSVPITFGMGRLPANPEQMSGAQRALALLLLGLIAWQLAVRAHVLRHALDVTWRTGLLIAVAFYALEFVATAVLWPVPGV